MNEASGDDPLFGLGYALWAYGFFLVAFFAYAGWVHLRAARLQARLEDVERRIREWSDAARRP